MSHCLLCPSQPRSYSLPLSLKSKPRYFNGSVLNGSSSNFLLMTCQEPHYQSPSSSAAPSATFSSSVCLQQSEIHSFPIAISDVSQVASVKLISDQSYPKMSPVSVAAAVASGAPLPTRQVAVLVCQRLQAPSWPKFKTSQPPTPKQRGTYISDANGLVRNNIPSRTVDTRHLETRRGS